MKRLITLLILIAPFLSFGQASKVISTQATPLPVADPNIAIVNLLDTPTAGGNLYRFYIAIKDSIRWNVFQIRGIKDSSQNWGDLRYVQSGITLPNPSYIGSLSAAKVFGLSPVATTGNYLDLTNLPNLSLKYDASNPLGFISGITNGMVLAALGLTPQAQLNGTGLVRMSGTTVSYDNSTYLTSLSLAGYWLKNDTLISSNYTTQYRVDSIKSKMVRYLDTILMLSPYLRKTDTSLLNLVTRFAAKENTITAGTNLQYWRGDKTWQTLNTAAVPESGNLYYTDARARAALSSGAGIAYNSTTGVISTAKRPPESYSGVSAVTTGLYTVTFSTPYSAIPNIQPSLPNQASTEVSFRISAVSTTGFTIAVYQRVTVLSLALSTATTPVSGVNVDVMVFEK